jgi:hypothetical protein
VILPRLIDKVRRHAEGTLPEEYHQNLLRPIDPQTGLYPLDGRFLAFTGLDPAALEKAILRLPDDLAVLAWIQEKSVPRTDQEKDAWREAIENAPPDEKRTGHRRRNYPSLAQRPDIGTLSPFDLIDLDEGRTLP